jgi:hypothetical protein
MRAPNFDFAIIPDVIDGDEAANDALINLWPWIREKHMSAPVWHLHESLDRLMRLAWQMAARLYWEFRRVCRNRHGSVVESDGRRLRCRV